MTTDNAARRSRGSAGRRAAAIAVPTAFALAVTVPTPVVAAPHDFPTWDEVQAARRSEAATAAEIERIDGILVRLEQEAAELGRQALELGEQYAQAQDALDAATAKLERIRQQAAEAQERATESRTRVALLVAQLARTGGGDVSSGLLLGSSANAEQLLQRLGTMEKLGTSSASLLDQAIYDQKTAEALAADAKAAETERQRLAAEAQGKYDAAQAAATQAEAAAAAQRDDVDRMYAQLATLKGTTAELERAYAEGQVLPPTSPDPGSPGTGGGSGGGGSGGGGGSTTPPPTTGNPPVANAVETAIAFAQAQLGEPYVLGGAGPDVWDCSGLTKMSYAAAGVYIGTHSATNQYNTMAAAGRLVPIGAIQRGDLLFYSSGGSTGGSKYHVTMYLGGGLMIEAPRPGVPVRIVAVRYGDLVPYAGRPTG